MDGHDGIQHDGNDFLRRQYEDWASALAEAPSLRLMRSLFEEWHQGTHEPAGVTYENRQIGGVSGLWVSPLGSDDSRVILYTHGGGFTVGSSASHRKMGGHLAKALACHAFVVDYRLAPEHPFPAQLEDCVAVYRGLLEHGYAASSLIMAGDSAGGNLAVSVPLEAHQQGIPIPAAVIAFSPWVDLEATGSTLLTNRQRDPLVTLEVVEGMIAGFIADGDSPRDPRLNPLYADLQPLPRLYINAGADEALLDDARRLHERAVSCGVDSTISIAEGQLHCFPMAAGRGSIADGELKKVAEWYGNGAREGAGSER